MIRILMFVSVSIIYNHTFAQKNVYLDSIRSFQDQLNKEFVTKETTVLLEKDFAEFKGLDFYPIDSTYCVTAKIKRTPGEKPFLMPTTTSRTPEYIKYGVATFNLKGKEYSLNLYQNTDPEFQNQYKDYLFLPFTDYTSGNGSYGGGRYVDLLIPEGNTLTIDFNKTYNPYCAYNPTRSCPIPPRENDLKTFVEAGVKDFKAH